MDARHSEIPGEKAAFMEYRPVAVCLECTKPECDGCRTRKKRPMKLSDTVNDMNSRDYRKRFLAEYRQTKIRYERLKDFCNRVEVCQEQGSPAPEHDCPVSLLREQQKHMGMYLSCLEKRAIYENINLGGEWL